MKNGFISNTVYVRLYLSNGINLDGPNNVNPIAITGRPGAGTIKSFCNDGLRCLISSTVA